MPGSTANFPAHRADPLSLIIPKATQSKQSKQMSQRYELKGQIGEGGIGTVHKAFDTQLKREVAIKRLIPVEGGNTAEAADNLLKEATTLSALQHPNIVTVYDVGTDDQGGFVVMELLKGETFDETINRGALTFDDFKNVVTQTLEALIAAHHTGLIHRDLKPSNLMVNWMPSGKFQIKILDFGLAKFSKQPSVQTIDQGDAILGSIYFMAPEQFERIALDARTDLYSMGCMYYQCLTGKYPFDGETAPQVMASHLQNRVTPLEKLRPDVPKWACDWVMWLISRKMDDRPESAKFAYERFQAEKCSPAQETANAAIAAAEAVTAQQQHAPAAAAVAVPVQAHPAHPPAPVGGEVTGPLGQQATGPLGQQPPVPGAPNKPSFPAWAMITIPVLIVIVILTAYYKFGGQGEKKKREEVVVTLHEQIQDEITPQGNRATVNVVVDYMIDKSDNKDLFAVCIQILQFLEGDGVDGAIVDSLKKLKLPIHLQTVIQVVAERGYKAGTPALIEYTMHENKQVREAALGAIAQLGAREQLPQLVGLAVKSIKAGKGNPYSNCIVQIANGIANPDERGATIRTAMADMKGKERGEMLEMLGYIGGDASLPLFKSALEGSDREEKLGALRGLTHWQDSAPGELLFKAASDKSDQGLQLVALKAYVLNIARPSPMSAEKKIEQIKKVYSEIERPKDKRTLFIGLRNIIDPAAKEFAEQLAQEEPAIARYATGAAQHIGEALKSLAVVTDSATLDGANAQLDAYLLEYSAAPDMKALTNWSHPQDRAYWPVRFEDAGTYSVEVTQACDQDDKDRYEVSIAGQKIKADVVDTGGVVKFQTEKVGEITIDEPGGYTLRVAPIALHGDLLMNLRDVRLKKVN